VKKSTKSVVLLGPSLPEEHNPNASKKNKVWVRHKSDLFDPSLDLSSLVLSNGKEIKRYKNYLFPTRYGKEVIGTYTTNKLTLIFITAGDSYYGDIKGYTLSTVVVDSNTGKVLKSIFYF